MAKEDLSMEEKFASTTSCHGISYVYQNDSGRLPRMIWLILTIAATAVCISQCIIIIYDASQLPTRITFSDVSANSTVFPSITICNTDNSPRDALPESDLKYLSILLHTQSTENAYNETQVQEAARYFIKKYGDKFDYENYIRTSSAKLENMLLRCQWMNRPCSLSDFTSIVTDYGNCFTFNPGTKDLPLKNQTVPGEVYGLRLAFNIGQYKYYPDLLDRNRPDAGIRFTIHYHKEPPNLLAKSIIAPVGSHTYVSFTRTYHKKLEKPWGECGSRKLLFHEFYSHVACIDEVSAIYASTLCNCSIIGAFGPYGACDSVKFITCIVPILAKARVQANENIAACPVACETYTYPTVISYGNLALIPISSLITNYLNVSGIIRHAQSLDWIKDPNYSTANFVRDNILYLDIYYSDLHTNAIEQKRATGFAEVLSNIGGQMGLFIGASIITIAEILQYLIRIFYNKAFNKPADKSKEDLNLEQNRKSSSV
ncbi:Acid-sensing ion channel 5 [Trichoplax sp. H2]|nr:Acid-sensing ion channel 5 [Trichoplax sp. H2]|eukprot:RDD47924.1 Acid-sensing ion channel 5 [Trichoplax sp. H2]